MQARRNSKLEEKEIKREVTAQLAGRAYNCRRMLLGTLVYCSLNSRCCLSVLLKAYGDSLTIKDILMNKSHG